ncbi:MAG: aspartate-semialdehyde dehydrogenase [Phycisphaerales bacterium]|nr:aspartate-semialdehyde dehydrogenase [Phycisphaerales bacterium]
MTSHSDSLLLGSIAIVGATGAVGRETLSILESRDVAATRITALASPRSAGTTLPYAGASLRVQSLDAFDFRGIDVAIFCATSAVARTHAPRAVDAGALVVDNSSAFRSDARIPLIVPEVNADSITPADRLIANPNCSTIILLVAIEPLRRRFGIRDIVVSTYQAVSGAGAAALEELRSQAADVLASKAPTPRVFKEPCAFNVFSHNSSVDPESGVNVEERKMIDETRKIWGDSRVRITPTCVRVPVFRTHSESVTLSLATPANLDEIRHAFTNARGIRIVDDRAANKFPTSIEASGGDDVLVGRLRPDPAATLDPSGRTTRWCLFIAGDQLRKGAAQNAVQIAELARIRFGVRIPDASRNATLAV